MLGLGVKTMKLPESKLYSMSIMVRVIVRVTNTQFIESKHMKIRLGDVKFLDGIFLSPRYIHDWNQQTS